MSLIYYKLKSANCFYGNKDEKEYKELVDKGFTSSNEYLFLDNYNKANDLIKLLNHKEIIIVDKYFFEISRELFSLKNCCYVFELNFWLVKPWEQYEIYRIKESDNNLYYQDYCILNDKYEWVWIPDICFDKTLSRDKIKAILIKTNKLSNSNENNEENLFHKDVIKLLLSNKYNNNLIKNVSTIQFIKEKCCRNTKKDISDYKKIEIFNLLPYEILGKIKYIENSLILLEYEDTDEEILKLIKESINLSLLITSEINKNTQINLEDEKELKINEFLNNTIDYIEMLKNNKNIIIKESEKQFTKNILDIIDTNNNLLKNMVESNTEIFKEK